MDLQTTPFFRTLLDRFAPVFTKPSHATFITLVSAWILTTGRKTLSTISLFAFVGPKRSLDAHYYFFSRASWSLDVLWTTLLCIVVDVLLKPGEDLDLIVDDTLAHKTGRTINGVGRWRDAVRSTKSKVVTCLGLNIPVLCLKVRHPWGGEPLALPIFIKLHRKNGPSNLELTADMVRRVHELFPDRQIRLVGDGAFAPLVGFTDRLNAGSKSTRRALVLISRLRRDAALYDLPPTKRKPGSRGPMPSRGDRLPSLPTMASRARSWKLVRTVERGVERERLVYTRIVIWKRERIQVVISRDPAGHEKDDYFFTTDPEQEGASVVAAYADRWCAEDTFKWSKQTNGAEKPQLQVNDGPIKAVSLGFAIYTLVWLWFLKEGAEGYRRTGERRYEKQKRPSFKDAQILLRGHMWGAVINDKSQQTSQPSGVFSILTRALAMAA